MGDNVDMIISQTSLALRNELIRLAPEDAARALVDRLTGLAPKYTKEEVVSEGMLLVQAYINNYTHPEREERYLALKQEVGRRTSDTLSDKLKFLFELIN